MSTMFLPPEKGDRRLFKLLFKWAQEQAKLQLGLERLGPVIYELESVLRWKVGDEITDELLSKLRYWFALVNSAHKRVFSRRRMLTQLESLAQIIRDASHVVGSADVRELLLRIGPNPPHPHWREAQSSEPIILNPEQQVSDQYKTHEDVQQAELELKKLRLGIIFALSRLPSETVEESLRGIPVLSGEPEFEWNLHLRIPGNYVKANHYGYVVWALATVFETVPGVEVIVESTGNGSFWAKLGIGIQNTAAKIEVEELLQKSLDALQSRHLDKHIAEAQKTSAEVEKLRAETESIRKQLESVPTKAEQASLHDIELADKLLGLQERLEKLRALKLQNQESELKLAERTAYLLKEGVIMAGTGTEIVINGVPFLENKDGKISTSGSIKEISARGFEPGKESEDEVEGKGEKPALE